MSMREEIAQDWQAALAALDWQLECGVDEVMGDAPIDRHDLPEAQPSPAPFPFPAPERPLRGGAGPTTGVPAQAVDALEAARAAARHASSLESLRDAIARFDHCELKRGARNTVFADGNPAARVLILGEAPGRDEDLEGRPFVGRAGQLLDRMFAAIGLSRRNPDAEAALYITNVMPWRPPGNRDPEPGEIAMMQPFVERHIELADPQVIVVMGNTPLFALSGERGILRVRGRWTQALGRPLLPMVHPAYLLRNPMAKREAWADLLSLRARLSGKQGS